MRLEKKNTQNRIRSEIKPILKQFQKAICDDLNIDFPYLTSVIHQLAIIQENSEEARAQLQGKLKESSTHFKVEIYPIETKHITEYNKKLLEENQLLGERYSKVLEQIKNMRMQFSRELNNRTTLIDQEQRKLKRYQEQGMFGMPGDDMDVSQIKFFDASDALDPETAQILEYRINQLKEKFAGWKIKQIDYVEDLSRKLHLYQNISKEFHGLINMPLEEIVQGLSLFDESPDTLWDMIVKHFSDQFFLPVIDKRYGHLFVNDTKRQQEAMLQAIAQTVENERILKAQCENQLIQIKYEKECAEDEVLKLRSTMQQAITTAEEISYDEGDNYRRELQEKEITDLKERIEYLEEENESLKLVTKDVTHAREQEQMKTMFTRMVAFTKAKQAHDLDRIEEQIRDIPPTISNSKVIDFISGRTNTKYEIEWQKMNQKLRDQEALNVQMILETNTMKRQWKRLEEERKHYKEEYEHHQAEHVTHKNACAAQQERFKSYNLQVQLMETNLKEQGLLLDSVEKERDQAVKDKQIAIRARGNASMGTSRAQQMDQYTKATKCLIAFNGWKNFYELNKINHLHRDKATHTEIRNTKKEIITLVQVDQPKAKDAPKATDEELALLRQAPSVTRGMQTDTEEFNAYLAGLGANFGKKLARQATMKSTDDQAKTVGTTCRMLDAEQVNCFIFDSLCNDKYLQKVIEEKRKYENVTNYDAETLGEENTFGQDQAGIGGIKMKQKGEKLPEAQRIDMRNKLPSIQESLGMPKHKQMHYPELQGVYKRLWQDAGLKDERMYQLRCQIDQLIKEQLEKKIHLQKNSCNDQLFKNSLLLNGFLEQIRLFIDKTINPPDLIDKMFDVKNLVLEGQAQSITPRIVESLSPRRQPSPQAIQQPKEDPINFRAQFRDKLTEAQVIAVCRFYIDKLKLILKKRKLYVRQARQSSPEKEIFTSNLKLHNEIMLAENQQNMGNLPSDKQASLIRNLDQRKKSTHIVIDATREFNAYKSGRDPMKDSITYLTHETLTQSQTNNKLGSGAAKINGDTPNILSSKIASDKNSAHEGVQINSQETYQQDTVNYENQPELGNRRNQDGGNHPLRSKYETEQVSKASNQPRDQYLASPPNFQSHAAQHADTYEQKIQNGRRSIALSAIMQKEDEEELKKKIEEEASANNLNFNFSRGRGTVFTNPPDLQTRSTSLGVTNTGFRYPDSTTNKHFSTKPQSSAGQKRKQRKKSGDKSSLYQQARQSDNYRASSSKEDKSFNLYETNQRASTAHGRRKLVKPYDDSKYQAKRIDNTADNHLRQYSNSYLKSLGPQHQLEHSQEIDNFVANEPLSAGIRNQGSNSVLGGTALQTASSKHLLSNKERITTPGDQYSSEYAPTRCESAVKGNLLVSRANDQWKFSQHEPKESSIPNEKFLQNLYNNQRIKKERKNVKGANKTSSISLGAGNVGSREMKSNKIQQGTVRPKLQVAAGGGGFSTTKIYNQFGFKSQPKLQLININNIKKNKIVDRIGKLNNLSQTKEMDRAQQLSKSLKGTGDTIYHSSSNLNQTNIQSQSINHIYSNHSPSQTYKSAERNEGPNFAERVASSLSPTGKSYIGNQIRAKHRATAQSTAEYRDNSGQKIRQSSTQNVERPEISIVGYKSNMIDSRAAKNRQIQQSMFLRSKNMKVDTEYNSMESQTENQ